MSFFQILKQIRPSLDTIVTCLSYMSIDTDTDIDSFRNKQV